MTPVRSAGAILALALLSLCPAAAKAQSIDSNAASVSLAASGSESLTLSVTGVSTVNFDLDGGTTVAGDNAISVDTDWRLKGNRTTLQIWGSFTSSTDALSDGTGYSIPSSAVQGRVATGVPTSFTAFTQTGPFGAAGAALKLVELSVSPPNHRGNRSDDLELQIDQTGLSLAAGDYSGTLTIQATAF